MSFSQSRLLCRWAENSSVSLLSQRHGGDHRKGQCEAGGVGTMAATSGVSLPIEEAGRVRSQVFWEKDRKVEIRLNGEEIYHLEATDASCILSLFHKEVGFGCILIVHSLTQQSLGVFVASWAILSTRNIHQWTKELIGINTDSPAAKWVRHFTKMFSKWPIDI